MLATDHSPARSTPPHKATGRHHRAEARRLLGLLCDGAARRPYNITRAPYLWNARTHRPIVSTQVEAGTWKRARWLDVDTGKVTDRPVTLPVMAQHLAGSYDIAIEAPSWTSCLVFDIDRHLPPPEALTYDDITSMTLQRDRTLSALWRALGLGPDKQPVILQTPSGGYHVYVPLLRDTPAGQEGRWPNGAMRRYVEHRLRSVGLALQPGVLELYPSGVPLRAPCGRGTLLVEAKRPDNPDDLELRLVPGTYRGEPAWGEPFHDSHRLQPQFYAPRSVRRLVQAFCDRIEAARRPLGDWLEQGDLWDERYGPFGRTYVPLQSEPANPRTPEDPTIRRCFPPEGGDSPGDGWLLRGPAFHQRIAALIRNGLTQPGQRHDAVLKLVFYWGATQSLPRDEVLRRLAWWLEAHPHRSHLRDASPERFIRDSLREGLHYYDHRASHCAGRFPPRGVDIGGSPLSPAEIDAFRGAVPADVWVPVRSLLMVLKTFAGPSGWVREPVELSHRLLTLICGDRRILREGKRRRAYVVALEVLASLGIVTLHRSYRVGSRCREFSVWYQFGTARLPGQTATGEREVASRALSEGVLRALAAGDGSLRVLLETRHLALVTAAHEAERAPWWQRMFASRVFTVGEFLSAQEGTVIPGPWRWRRASSFEVRYPRVTPGGSRAPPTSTRPMRRWRSRSAPPHAPGAPPTARTQLALPLPASPGVSDGCRHR